MYRFWNSFIFVAAIAACSTLVSCDSEKEDSHDLVVAWNIAGLPVCSAFLPADQYAQEDVVFDTVEINIYEDADGTVPLQEAISVPCDDFEYTLTRLERGSYYVSVDAITMYGDEDLAFFNGAQVVSVPADEGRLELELAVASGELQVVWQFTGGTICGVDTPGEVSDVVVLVDGVELVAECSAGQILMTNLAPSPEYEISAQALSSDGEVLYETELEAPIEVLPGQSYRADLVF